MVCQQDSPRVPAPPATLASPSRASGGPASVISILSVDLIANVLKVSLSSKRLFLGD
jgi:hypothetical protein